MGCWYEEAVSCLTPVFALVALLSVGCTCSSSTTLLAQPDGGIFVCVTGEDCPRTGNDLVCDTTSPPDYTSACVSCVATQCRRTVVNCP